MERDTLLENSQVVEGYFGICIDNLGQKYGVRLATAKDAYEIVRLYSEIYDNIYIEPGVSDVLVLEKNLKNPNEFWFVGEIISNKVEKEIVGSGTVKKSDELTLSASKAVISKKYQKRGVGNALGTKGILTALSLPQFSNTIRLVAEARAFNLYSQKVMEKAGASPYAFNPVYVNYGRRNWKEINENNPYLGGSIEPAIYYLRPLPGFWKKRDYEIQLLDNEDILYFYQIIKNQQKRMKRDQIIIGSKLGINWQECEITPRSELGGVFIKGYLHNALLQHYLYKYSGWRYIEWRVPTTEKGLDSMNLALNNNFKVIGYDIGSLQTLDDHIVDCVIFARFLKPIRMRRFKYMDLTNESSLLAYKVLSQL